VCCSPALCSSGILSLLVSKEIQKLQLLNRLVFSALLTDKWLFTNAVGTRTRRWTVVGHTRRWTVVGQCTQRVVFGLDSSSPVGEFGPGPVSITTPMVFSSKTVQGGAKLFLRLMDSGMSLGASFGNTSVPPLVLIMTINRTARLLKSPKAMAILCDRDYTGGYECLSGATAITVTL
jgi:hypothetical protein